MTGRSFFNRVTFATTTSSSAGVENEEVVEVWRPRCQRIGDDRPCVSRLMFMRDSSGTRLIIASFCTHGYALITYM